jgi:integrase
MGKNEGIREASKTSYEITFAYRGERCRERIKLKPNAVNRKRLENWLGAIKSAIDQNSFDYSVTFPNSKNRFKFIANKGNNLLLSQYLDNWLESKKKTIKASTHLSYAKACKLIVNAFIGVNLADLKRSDIKSWLAALTSSNKNISNLQSVLRSALQDAVNDELIENNPLYGWKYTNNETPKTVDDVDPFSIDEQQDILNELDGQNKNMFIIFFWSGMRPSELIALNWDDIDFRRGIIKVNKSFTQAATDFETTKTKAGKRDIKILGPAMDALINQKKYTYLKNKEIFQNPKTMERWQGDRAIRNGVWRPALKRAKVRYRRPYQTRHTYASMMLTAGESIAWLAKQLGHSSIITTMNVYAKYIKDSIPDAGENAVAMFTKKAGKKAGNSSPF